MAGPDDHDVPDAILASDASTRLAAVIRRHGGTPKPDHQPTDGKPRFPPIGRRDCEGQESLIESAT